MIDKNLQKAWLEWANLGRDLVVRRIQDRLLSGQVVRRRSGRLFRDVEETSEVLRSKKGFTIATSLFYGRILEKGSRGVTIRPQRRKALRFFMSGREIFAASVRIPARPARSFLWRGLDESKSKLAVELNRLSQKALDTSFPDRRIEVAL